MFLEPQHELNKLSETPSEDASAELHVEKAIERFYYRENVTTNVKIDAYKLEEFYKMYKQQQIELKELRQKVKDARKLLKL